MERLQKNNGDVLILYTYMCIWLATCSFLYVCTSAQWILPATVFLAITLACKIFLEYNPTTSQLQANYKPCAEATKS